MRRRPPAISLTRVTYSCAISLKMSLAPHAPCIFSTTGDWATEIIGAETAAAPAAAAAPVRNLRRVGEVAFGATLVLSSCIFPPRDGVLRLKTLWKAGTRGVPAD